MHDRGDSARLARPDRTAWRCEPAEVQAVLPKGFVVDPSGRRVVWFLSLDITRLLPTVVARLGRRLAGSDLTDLDHVLSARWALGTTFGRRLMWAEVSHPPWPIHAAELLECSESLIE